MVNHGLHFIANAERLLFPALRAVLGFRERQSPKSLRVCLRLTLDCGESGYDCSSHHLLSAIGNLKSYQGLRTQFDLGVELN